jgi:hypothetical protein
MKLDKKTLKWAAKQIEAYADDCEIASKRATWDSNAIASRKECADRAYVFRLIAKQIRKGKKKSSYD